jgi:plastocyanin
MTTQKKQRRPKMSSSPRSAQSAGPKQVTVPIHMEHVDLATGEQKGTFKSPWPKLTIKSGTQVQWQNEAGFTFLVDFGNTSPFPQQQITDSNYYTATGTGTFKYSVTATHTASGFSSSVDPDLDVIA